MSDPLPMPNDVKPPTPDGAGGQPMIEPPSAGLIVRLFLIPFLIVAAAVGVMFLFGRMAGDAPTFDDSLKGLRTVGGEKTADVLLGPGSKQRYLWAKTLVDQMKDPKGMSLEERIKISDALVDILDNHSSDNEGDVRHFLLLAIGRAWQINPQKLDVDTSMAEASRAKARDTLLKYSGDASLQTRKAAILATVYWAGRPEIAQFKPVLISRVVDPKEDIDIRLAAATVLGPTSTGDEKDVVEALKVGLRDGDTHNIELVWQSAVSLAQLNQSDAADTILKLLDRNELATLQYFDRESDPKNPAFRKLTEKEQERILVNTLIGSEKLNNPAVQEKRKQIGQTDPVLRVREAYRKPQ